MNSSYIIHGDPKDLHRRINELIRSGNIPVTIGQIQPVRKPELVPRSTAPSYARQVINLGRRY